MKILIALNHPAHYYLFKYIAKGLCSIGYKVEFVIKEKDILERLLIFEDVEYSKICSKRNRKKNFISIVSRGGRELIKQNFNLLRLVNKSPPDIMMGTDISITHVGTIKKIPTFVFNEDDYEINRFFCKLAYPFASHIISPEYCSVGKYIDKKIPYNGIQKMAYLNSKYYTPNDSILKDLGIVPSDHYFLIRLVSLTSGHDIEGKHYGIDMRLLHSIIKKLESSGKVFITSETPINKRFASYQLTVPPNKIHDVMAFARLFIGDSQTMCAEAGILGVPFIRYNDYVGKISYLNDLELNYELGYGISTKNSHKLEETIDNIISDDRIISKMSNRRTRLFKDKIDLTAFVIWLITNYPDSIEIIKQNPDFQYTFR